MNGRQVLDVDQGKEKRWEEKHAQHSATVGFFPAEVGLVEIDELRDWRSNNLILPLPSKPVIRALTCFELFSPIIPSAHYTVGHRSTKSRALWLDVIEGRQHKLLHGYYCTWQPDDEERAKGITSSPRLWLGFVWLWLHILEAKAKAVREGLAWLGFGSSQGLGDIFFPVPGYRSNLQWWLRINPRARINECTMFLGIIWHWSIESESRKSLSTTRQP
ncbi:hypothetical protein B0H10DRAFT_2186906 [Mycena sp. CBHHK59/15]|nr:hypothetical protein B0H10DRAFT_2186906 [Mycena sp. CBHHK59/15]